ncbi:DUF6520 family protein [Leeuwenhoekiella sp. MAR_2009_132]|uniref:DUF6520 family protein n=1 Tax=Leeuwenhoekiella sp. MAR_2009_132 TaxID=1392489 RepID=UPI00048D2816|nr:DUF6520 family protein [Leeuwenhoekiella sp. MAR_2009_132]
MKKSKIMIPVMTLGLAVGLAFANTTTVVSGWIDLDGIPTQLDSEPCQGTGEICHVKFDNDPQEREFPVYTDMSLTTLKDSNTTVPYQLPALP